MSNKEFNKLRNMLLYARTHYILKKALEQFYDDIEFEEELQSRWYNNHTEFINDLLEESRKTLFFIAIKD